MGDYELKLDGGLKEAFGSIQWDKDQNGSLNYEEIKYQPNDEVIRLLNQAYGSLSAKNFFRSIPLFRVGGMAIESLQGVSLDTRYFEQSADENISWLVGVCETILTSGLHDAWEAADRVLLAGTTLYNRARVLSLLGSREYIDDRKRLVVEIAESKDADKKSKKEVTPETIRQFQFDKKFRIQLRDKLLESKSHFAARHILSGLEKEQQYLLVCEIISWGKNKIFDAKEPLSLNSFQFNLLVQFLQGYFQDDPENYYRLYSFIMRRDKGVAEYLIMFLSNDELKQLFSLDKKAEKKLEKSLMQERELRQGKALVTKIESVKDFDKEVLQNQKPTLVVFGAQWCSPCQVLKPKLAHWARVYQEKASISYVSIDASEELQEVLKKMTNGKFGLPHFAIYQAGNLIEEGYFNLEMMKKWNAVVGGQSQ